MSRFLGERLLKKQYGIFWDFEKKALVGCLVRNVPWITAIIQEKIEGEPGRGRPRTPFLMHDTGRHRNRNKRELKRNMDERVKWRGRSSLLNCRLTNPRIVEKKSVHTSHHCWKWKVGMCYIDRNLIYTCKQRSIGNRKSILSKLISVVLGGVFTLLPR